MRIILFLLAMFVVATGYLLLKQREIDADHDLELLVVRDQAVQETASQLRGNLPVEITNEQIQWFNAGRNSWVENIQSSIRTFVEEDRVDEFVFRVNVDGEEYILKIEE